MTTVRYNGIINKDLWVCPIIIQLHQTRGPINFQALGYNLPTFEVNPAMGISDINSQLQIKANECNLTLFLYTSLPYCAYILYITHTLSKQKHKTLNFTMNQSTRTVHGRRSRESMRAHYHHVHHTLCFCTFLGKPSLKRWIFRTEAKTTIRVRGKGICLKRNAFFIIKFFNLSVLKACPYFSVTTWSFSLCSRYIASS